MSRGAMAPTGRKGARRDAKEQRRRQDRDGDVSMGSAKPATTSKIAKPSKIPTGPAADRRRQPAGTRTDLTSKNIQSKILRSNARGDVNLQEVSKRGVLAEFKVSGWEKSEAYHNKDQGVSALEKWLEGKMTKRLGSASKRQAKITRTRREGDVLFVSVPETDARALQRMSGFVWAGAKIIIERVGGAVQDTKLSSQAEQIKAMLRGVLEKRFSPETKLLDLSALGQDEDLKAQNVFDQKSTTSKFFPALMKVLEGVFDKPAELHAAIESVSLANNDLTDLAMVKDLSYVLPHLHNLDLSNNKFAKLENLGYWRRRFQDLQHLIVSGNPLEQNEPDFAKELVSRYPKLRILNQTQVRTDEDIAKSNTVPNLPFPIRSALFLDENQISENFIKSWIDGFDNNRSALAQTFYDDQSQFSLAVNTSAPRDPAGSVTTGPNEWDAYLKHSRNIKKVSNLPTRQSRLHRGTAAVDTILQSLPQTKHPDLYAEARKYMIEAQIQPYLPDPTGQSHGGVDGFNINMHCEYDEIDPKSQQVKNRSADHFIQIGPGGPTGVRVISHIMTVRAYGGAQAFEPEPTANGAHTPPPTAADIEAYLAAGLTLPQAEEICVKLAELTGMTMALSKDCLDHTAWNPDAALAKFHEVKLSLGPESFTNGKPLI